MDERTPDLGGVEWEPFISHGRMRIIETACCGAYEWACQGGQYLVLRATRNGGYEETGRGRYPDARQVWDELVLAHRCEHGTGVRATRRSRREA